MPNMEERGIYGLKSGLKSSFTIQFVMILYGSLHIEDVRSSKWITKTKVNVRFLHLYCIV